MSFRRQRSWCWNRSSRPGAHPQGRALEGTPSFGFRPGLGPHDALAAVDENARQGFRWVVDADLEQFFDTLDHQQLMAALRRRISDGELLRLIYRWLKAGYLWDGEQHDTDQGSPQGSVISPLLANVYLHALDQAQQAEKSFVGRLVRYADDFVIQCGTREHAERALAWAREELAALGLRLHPEKTRIVEDRPVRAGLPSPPRGPPTAHATGLARGAPLAE